MNMIKNSKGWKCMQNVTWPAIYQSVSTLYVWAPVTVVTNPTEVCAANDHSLRRRL